MNRIYVTTSIPYVNARPHVGFALELAQADAVARYHRLVGREVRFQTGTDENAFKNILAAKALGLSAAELVERNSHLYRRLCGALSASPDDFIRTTEPRHRLGVHEFWRRLRPSDGYKAGYRGLYCDGCEDFLQEKELVDGHCPDHAAPLVEVEEENHFFRLSAYQGQVEDLIGSGRVKVVPAQRRNEVLSFVASGLRDFSVSRSAERAPGWGIPVPGDATQVIYVWIDALINYLSAPGLGSGEGWRRFWNEDVKKVHVIGKNVWKFHAVYWPALLLSAGLPLPDEIVVHGFLTVDGRKISKSLGNVVDPLAVADEFGADALRHYLLKGFSPFADGDFSLDRLVRLHNAHLADGLGNLVGRVASLCAKSEFGRFSPHAVPEAPEGYHEALACYEFDKAIAVLWSVVTRVNQEIERTRPWDLLKTPGGEAVRTHLQCWLTEVHRVGHWLSPFLPDASRRVLEALSQDRIAPCRPLFPRRNLPAEVDGRE